MLKREGWREGYGPGNLELRYIFYHPALFGRKLDLAANSFTDFGMVTRLYAVSTTQHIAALDYQPGQERIHSSMDEGFRMIIDYNFIVAFNCGKSLNRQDGNTSLYINLNYLFRKDSQRSLFRAYCFTNLLLLICSPE